MHRVLGEGTGWVALSVEAAGPLDNTGRFCAVVETELSHRKATSVLLVFEGLAGRTLAPLWKTFEFQSQATDQVQRAALVGPADAGPWLARLGRMLFPEAEIAVETDEVRGRAALAL